MERRYATRLAAAILVSMLVTGHVRAADTVETWALGPTDVELFAGYEGLGLGPGDRGLHLELLQGFGIVERFSAYIGAGLGPCGDPLAAFHAGTFGTVLETDHLDLDLFFDISSSGPGLAGLSVGPAFELNVDARPDLALVGIYLRAGAPVSGFRLSSKPHPGHRPHVAIQLLLGGYWTVAPAHQILVEADAAFHPLERAGERPAEVGGAALGYNVILHPAVELVTELFLDIPQTGRSFSASVTAGIILTRPFDKLGAAD